MVLFFKKEHAFFLLPIIACLASAGVLWRVQAPGPLPADTALIVPRGGIDDIALSLQRQRAIGSLWVFRLAAGATRFLGPLRSGEFLFPAHASVVRVLLVLRTAGQIEHAVTIPEGLTSAQVALLLAKLPGITGPITVPAEGSVLPETYRYIYGTPADALVARLRAAMAEAVAGAWRGRAPGGALQSPGELIVLASMVEREAHLASDRALISRVFQNRLRLHMRLQSDPTVIYGASGGMGWLPGPLSKEALQTPWPTNTYSIDGLPPGPICNPGMASIEAAAHPADSSALYFVADGTGGHAFSTTLAEHNKNVVRYRAMSH